MKLPGQHCKCVDSWGSAQLTSWDSFPILRVSEQWSLRFQIVLFRKELRVLLAEGEPQTNISLMPEANEWESQSQGENCAIPIEVRVFPAIRSYSDGGDTPVLRVFLYHVLFLWMVSSVIGFNGWYDNELVFKILFILAMLAFIATQFSSCGDYTGFSFWVTSLM